jgi:hypothetical protein
MVLRSKHTTVTLSSVLLPSSFDFAERDAASLVNREAECPGADGWERDRPKSVTLGKRERILVAARQQFFLARLSAVPDRADRVDNMAGGEPVAAGDLCIPRRTTAQGSAFLQKVTPGGGVDRAVHSPAAQERAVCRIHDGVNGQLRDVALDDLNALRPGTRRESALLCCSIPGGSRRG